MKLKFLLHTELCIYWKNENVYQRETRCHQINHTVDHKRQNTKMKKELYFVKSPQNGRQEEQQNKYEKFAYLVKVLFI